MNCSSWDLEKKVLKMEASVISTILQTIFSHFNAIRIFLSSIVYEQFAEMFEKNVIPKHISIVVCTV